MGMSVTIHPGLQANPQAIEVNHGIRRTASGQMRRSAASSAGSALNIKPLNPFNPSSSLYWKSNQSEEEPTPAAPVAVQPWPKDLKDQLAALRALLLSSDRLWSLQDMADAFKSRGRYREGISTQVELLADLGVITKVETSKGPAFHRPQALGT